MPGIYNKFMSTPETSRRDWLKTALAGGGLISLAPGALGSGGSTAPAKKVRGIVFMVSDGMSPGVLTLAEAYSQLTRKSGTRWWSLLNDRQATAGFMDTASADSLVTDSAAASTSWGGGERVNNGSINVRPDGRPLDPLARALGRKGIVTGLVTTATITHATPAGFAAICPQRGNEQEIATQYLHNVDILLGGGSGYFSADQRADHRDLAADFTNAGYDVVRDRDGLLASKSPKLLGIFTAGHLPYTIDRNASETLRAKIPTLREMTAAALDRLLAADRPFLLQVEGARIDHAAHRNDIGALLHEQIAFDESLTLVLDRLAGRDDILVVVTSDHANANPGLNGSGGGYRKSTAMFSNITRQKASFEQLFTEWEKTGEKENPKALASLVEEKIGFKPKTSEAEALIESFAKRPVIEWNEQLAKPEGLLGQFSGNHNGVGWTSTSHTSECTLISALGPQSERFRGIVRNSDVYGKILDMLV